MLPAVQTLERSYLLRVNGVVVERPQHMLMRVSVGIHKEVRTRGMSRWLSQAHPRAMHEQPESHKLLSVAAPQVPWF